MIVAVFRPMFSAQVLGPSVGASEDREIKQTNKQKPRLNHTLEDPPLPRAATIVQARPTKVTELAVGGQRGERGWGGGRGTDRRMD